MLLVVLPVAGGVTVNAGLRNNTRQVCVAKEKDLCLSTGCKVGRESVVVKLPYVLLRTIIVSLLSAVRNAP